MADVEFQDEEEMLLQVPKQAERIPTLGKIILKLGIVKNTSQINLALIIISLCIFALSVFIAVYFI